MGEFALKNPKTQFLVEYTVLDAILTFYSIKDMAKMFSDFAIPKNIIFEEEYYEGFDENAPLDSFEEGIIEE